MTAVPARELGLVFAGGALGTTGRALLGVALPNGWVAVPTLVVNVVGACAIGVLYAALAGHDPGGSRTRGVRLFWGTGVLGGFTTYSALTVAVVTHGTAGLAYAAVSVVLGVLAAGLGARVGGLLGGGLGRSASGGRQG